MKTNKGFTLIELLAAIIILAGVALVAFPILLNTIKNSEEQIDDTTKRLIINAAKLYVDENANDYPLVENNTYCIIFDELINSNKLEKGIIGTTNIDYSNKTVKIKVNNGYNYEIVNSEDCE